MIKKEKGEIYFGEREELAVVDYINEESPEVRNQIFNEILKKPFKKMIEIIIKRYPIYLGSYTIKEVEWFALSHLMEQIVKFNPDMITKKGNKTKAFSYCQTIVRNYCKDHGKKNYNEKKTNLLYDDFVDEIDEKNDYQYEIELNENNELDLLIRNVTEKIQEKIDNVEEIKKNELIVGEAIINVLNNWHLLFLEDTPEGKYNKRVTNKFAKNKILFFLKEQTGLSTKEIRLSMKPFKDIYFIEKTVFYNN
jgi:hypothetical protein